MTQISAQGRTPGRTPEQPLGQTPVVLTAGTVVGDGSTATSTVRARWRRGRTTAIVIALLVVVAALSVLPRPRTSGIPLAPDNPSPAGGRAVARILADRGVTVEYVRTTATAVARATSGATLLVTSTDLLDSEQVAALGRTTADIVLVDPSAAALGALSDGRADRYGTPRAPGTTVSADCSDDDARAAGQITVDASGLLLVDGAGVVCFPGGDPSTGAYLVLTGSRRLTALASAEPLTNGALARAGNAAIALRALGRNTTLVWYVPSPQDSGTDQVSAPGLGDLLPPQAGLVGVQLLLVALVAAVWRGRRLGRLVTEPLPVVVRSSETVRGRGRLYRRSRSLGHAAAALRAGTARRCATRVGLARSADAVTVIDALARATGRPSEEIAALLYGPPPTDDGGLAHLARRLDDLESEVHRT
ncbi:hypothetical protein GALL_441050 [mine drainage metagenome]|uniref:DUF4350 domain-containing protein n=1 Tax=mine drainage metagenome TaxID=410659 RepID=A0A1J5Q2M5_9ZZZZ